MSSTVLAEYAEYEVKETELMDEARRKAMRAAGWRIIKIDCRRITWRRDSNGLILESK